MATKNLKALMLGTVEKSAAEKAAQDKSEAQAVQAPAAPAPVAAPSPAAPAPKTPNLVGQVRANLTRGSATGKLDTIAAVDPASMRIQATTRMPTELTRQCSYKLDARMVDMLNRLCMGQNQTALMSYLMMRGLVQVMGEMKDKDTNVFHHSFDAMDRNQYLGVDDETVMAMVRWVEQNQS